MLSVSMFVAYKLGSLTRSTIARLEEAFGAIVLVLSTLMIKWTRDEHAPKNSRRARPGSVRGQLGHTKLRSSIAMVFGWERHMDTQNNSAPFLWCYKSIIAIVWSDKKFRRLVQNVGPWMQDGQCYKSPAGCGTETQQEIQCWRFQ